MRAGPQLLAAMAGLLAASAPGLAADAGHGGELARQHCGRCHVLPGESNFGIGSTPSFKIMVMSKLPDWRQRFENFYALRPHPNFVRIRELPQTMEAPPVVAPFTLTLGDIEDILAFVDQLAAEYRK
jgi:mono/diheme cytochrome c family protein